MYGIRRIVVVKEGHTLAMGGCKLTNFDPEGLNIHSLKFNRNKHRGTMANGEPLKHMKNDDVTYRFKSGVEDKQNPNRTSASI